MPWKRIFGTAMNVLALVATGVTAAEIKYGPGNGPQKQKDVEETTVPVLDRLATTGDIKVGADDARVLITQVITGVVALFNLIGFFNRNRK